MIAWQRQTLARWRAVVLAVLAALLVVTVAVEGHAQRRQPGVSYADWRQARKLFNQGHLAYRRGDYEEAIVKWEKSRELSKEPIIYESVANAYERLGDARKALANLQKWRASAPKREHRSLDERLERLEERVAELDEEDRQREEKEATLRKEHEQRERELREAERQKKIAAERKRLAEEDMSAVIGWSVTGLGGAAVIAGVALDLVAAGQRPSEQEACADQAGQLLCRSELQSDIESSNTLALAGDVLWIAGSAVAVTGVVLLFTLGPPDVDEGAFGEDVKGDDADDTEAWLTPLVTPNGGGVVVVGTF